MNTPQRAARERARELLSRLALFLYRRRYTELCGGNISMRVGDEVIMTPTKASERYGWRVPPESLLLFSPGGDVLEGDPSQASRETDLHLRTYRRVAHIQSVFHLHMVEAIAAGETMNQLQPAAALEPRGVHLSVLDADLEGQTEEHDARIEELFALAPVERGHVIIAPGHGIFSAAVDAPANVHAIDALRRRLAQVHLRASLR